MLPPRSVCHSYLRACTDQVVARNELESVQDPLVIDKIEPFGTIYRYNVVNVIHSDYSTSTRYNDMPACSLIGYSQAGCTACGAYKRYCGGITSNSDGLGT